MFAVWWISLGRSAEEAEKIVDAMSLLAENSCPPVVDK